MADRIYTADIKVGVVYTDGKPRPRFRYVERIKDSGLVVVRFAKVYAGRRGLDRDDAGVYDTMSLRAMSRWAERAATPEETAAVLAVLGVPRG